MVERTGRVAALGSKSNAIREGGGESPKIDLLKLVELCFAGLLSPNSDIRKRAAEGLKLIFPIPAVTQEDKILYGIAKGDWDSVVGIGEPAVPYLFLAFKEGDWELRKNSLQTLVKITGARRAVPYLGKALFYEGDYLVGVHIVKALGRIGGIRVMNILLKFALEHELSYSNDVKKAFVSMGEPAKKHLRGILKTPSWEAKKFAAQLLDAFDWQPAEEERFTCLIARLDKSNLVSLGEAAIPYLRGALLDGQDDSRRLFALMVLEALHWQPETDEEQDLHLGFWVMNQRWNEPEAYLGRLIDKLRKANPANGLSVTQPLTPEMIKSLVEYFESLDIKDLMIGTKEYIKMRIFVMYYLEGKSIIQIKEAMPDEIMQLRGSEKRCAYLPTTGCEIGLPLSLAEEEKKLIILEAQLQGVNAQEEIRKKEIEKEVRGHYFKALTNFLMQVDGNTIPGVRPSDIEDKDEMHLRILPTNWEITIKILDTYIRALNLFTIKELISASYATTVRGELKYYQEAAIAAISFFLDRVKREEGEVRVFTGGEVLPPLPDSVGSPGAMVWQAVNPRATVGQTVETQGTLGEVVWGQITFNYHNLAVAFESINPQGKHYELLYQYPSDYARIAYLVALAEKEPDKFNSIFLEPLLSFYEKRLGIEKKVFMRTLSCLPVDGAITNAANILYRGFFEGKDRRAIKELLLEHQVIVDGIMMRVKEAGNAQSDGGYGGVNLKKAKEQLRIYKQTAPIISLDLPEANTALNSALAYLSKIKRLTPARAPPRIFLIDTEQISFKALFINEENTVYFEKPFLADILSSKHALFYLTRVFIHELNNQSHFWNRIQEYRFIISEFISHIFFSRRRRQKPQVEPREVPEPMPVPERIPQKIPHPAVPRPLPEPSRSIADQLRLALPYVAPLIKAMVRDCNLKAAGIFKGILEEALGSFFYPRRLSWATTLVPKTVWFSFASEQERLGVPPYVWRVLNSPRDGVFEPDEKREGIRPEQVEHIRKIISGWINKSASIEQVKVIKIRPAADRPEAVIFTWEINGIPKSLDVTYSSDKKFRINGREFKGRDIVTVSDKKLREFTSIVKTQVLEVNESGLCFLEGITFQIFPPSFKDFSSRLKLELRMVSRQDADIHSYSPLFKTSGFSILDKDGNKLTDVEVKAPKKILVDGKIIKIMLSTRAINLFKISVKLRDYLRQVEPISSQSSGGNVEGSNGRAQFSVRNDYGATGYLGNVKGRARRAAEAIVNRGNYKEIKEFNGLVTQIKGVPVRFGVLPAKP